MNKLVKPSEGLTLYVFGREIIIISAHGLQFGFFLELGNKTISSIPLDYIWKMDYDRHRSNHLKHMNRKSLYGKNI